MTTPVMTINAPSQVVRKSYPEAVRNRIVGIYTGTTNWLRATSDRLGVSRAISFTRKYLSKAWRFGATFVRAAGAVPLAILAATSHTGQRAIAAVTKTAYGLVAWAGRAALGIVKWTLRLFGAPGRKAADWVTSTQQQASGFISANAKKAFAVVRPYISPDRGYMRVAKGVSYAIVAAGLIGAFVSGVWVIPAYIGAAGFGLLSIPEVRASVLVNRLVGAFEDRTKTLARRTVAESMEAMMDEYGPEMSSWTQTAKADYALKRAIYNYLDGVQDPFNGLSGNQRKKAERWLENFSNSLKKIEHGVDGLVGNAEMSVDSEGHVTVKPVLESVPPPA